MAADLVCPYFTDSDGATVRTTRQVRGHGDVREHSSAEGDKVLLSSRDKKVKSEVMLTRADKLVTGAINKCNKLF